MRQYAKLKMEVKLERRIFEPETIDHNDGNTRNDRYSNLVIRSRSEHAKLDVKRKVPRLVKCIQCGNKFETTRHLNSHNRDKNKAGPFCSKTCTGKYGASVQNGGKRKSRVLYKLEKKSLKET